MSFIAYALLVFVVLALVAVWFWCLVQIVARPDMSFWAKALWIVGILVLPVVGAIAFLIYFRKLGPVNDTKEWDEKSAEEIEQQVFRSENIAGSERMDRIKW
jgi:type VI protein secretion system component VasK